MFPKGPELIIILVIAGLIFGPSLLPMLGQRIGKTLKGARDVTKEFSKAMEDDEDDEK